MTGPACTETADPIAGVSKHYNTIIISYGAESLHLANRDAFPLFFRTVPPSTQNVYVFTFVLVRFGIERQEESLCSMTGSYKEGCVYIV